MGKAQRRSANARKAAYDKQPTRSLTQDDYSRIRFTQPKIHPTFSNPQNLSVFELYFAIRYELMNVSNIPPIRVFEDDETGKLWSVDNRRLWVMKTAQRGFNCENLYTREQDPSRYQEVENKIRSLKGTTGEYISFESVKSADLIHQCCINAFKRDQLDSHIANDHLNINLEEMILLTQCPLHYNDQVSCDCLTKLNFVHGKLKDMVSDRCGRVRMIMNDAQLTPSTEYTQLFEKLKSNTPDLLINWEEYLINFDELFA